MNALIVLGHPRRDSFCHALAQAYEDGARETNVNVDTLLLTELEFEPNVYTESPVDQNMEPDLLEAQNQIRWADHLVLVYPNWWGTMPGMLKAFFDRVFTSGFAFSFYEDGEGAGHEELLDDKTAELIVTMDMPTWVYRWIYRRPGTNALKRATLGFAGIETTRVTYFGPVDDSTVPQRARWIDKATRLGNSLSHGPEPPTREAKRTIITWLKALRLQFYPMSWVAYTIGALTVAGSEDLFSNPVYWLGFVFLFFLEAATVLSNEYFDYPTDRENTFAGPFTGGSRVLVNEQLSFQAVQIGIGVTLLLSAMFGAGVLLLGGGSIIPTAVVMVTLAVLALGYTVPPLKLSYRTLGELDVAVTHSIGVMFCGVIFLGGSWHNPIPWLLSIPYLLSIIPSITLAGVPDFTADQAAGKKTIAVRFGIDRAVLVAKTTALLAAITAMLWQMLDLVPTAYAPVIYLSVVHALGLVWFLDERLGNSPDADRIDGLLIASLSYILWFGCIPLFRLL